MEKLIEDIFTDAKRSSVGELHTIEFINSLITNHGMKFEISEKGMVFYTVSNKEYNCIIRFKELTFGYLIKNLVIDDVLIRVINILRKKFPTIQVSGIKYCGKCGGEGKLSHYQHIDGGVCFKCKGQGFILTK